MDELGDAGTKWCTSPPVTLNVVFVHGFQGDHLATWTYKKNDGFLRGLFKRAELVTMFDLLVSDSRFHYNYYSVAHSGGIGSTTDIEKAGGVLRTFLRNYVICDNDAPVALIAHSFGGLACRFAILEMLEDLGDKIPVVGLLMMGTPNSGTEIARAAKALGSSAGSDMTPYDRMLANLNRNWTSQIVNGGDPGKDPNTRAPLICWSVVGTEDRVVPAASASSLASFSNVEYLNKGHIALVKARDHNDSTYILISRFLERVEKYSAIREGEWAVKHLTYRLRKASLEGRWVRKEQTVIQLENTQVRGRLKCRIINVRKGGVVGPVFNVCVWISGYRPNIQTDLDWEIGKGVLSEAEFDRMADNADEKVKKYFEIEGLCITQGNRKKELEYVGEEKGAGWFLMTYKLPDDMTNTEPYTELSIEVSTYVDRGQGWMFYALPRTVTESLEVIFRAPFSYGVICRLGRGHKLEKPVLMGGEYVSRATVKGQVSIGRSIIWVYECDRNQIA